MGNFATPHKIASLVEEDRPICYGVLKPGDYCDQGVPLVRIVDLEGDKIKEDRLFRISPALDRQFIRSKLNGGELLLSIQGTIGRVAITPQTLNGANISRTIARLAIKPKHSASFIRCVLLSEHGQRLVRDVVMGTTRDSLNIGALREIEIDLPLPVAQIKIAEILSTVDETIEQTEALIAKYQQIRAGLMHDLFTRGVTPDGHLRPTRARAPHLYRESPLGWIPKEWKFGVLDGFSDMHNNLRKPISAEVRETMRGEYPYYGPTGILDYINEFLIEGEFCLIGEDGDHFLKFAEWPMTILVGGRFNVNNHAHILSGRNGATTRWLHAFFLNRDITFHLTRQGAGRFKLNKAALKKLPICVPDPAEQYEVLDRIEAAQSSIKAQNRQLDKLRQQKHGLMQDLLTGRVRVNVAEPAST